MASKLLGYHLWRPLACNIPVALSQSTGVRLGIENKQGVILNFKLDIRLEISVAGTCVNLIKMSVHA